MALDLDDARLRYRLSFSPEDHDRLPFYSSLLRALEDDEVGLELLASIEVEQRNPMLVLAALHLAALRGHDTGPATDAANLIATRSPIALAVTLASVRRAAQLESLEQVLVQEYRVSCASLRSHDLVEGIRAQLVDKDRNPKWSPASLAAVTEDDVDAYFGPADPDLTF